MLTSTIAQKQSALPTARLIRMQDLRTYSVLWTNAEASV
jgi:hypothetical protein